MVSLKGKSKLQLTIILLINLVLISPNICKAEDYSLEGKWVDKFDITITNMITPETAFWQPRRRFIEATSELYFNKSKFELNILDDDNKELSSYSGKYFTKGDTIFFKPYPPKPDTTGRLPLNNGDTLYRVRTVPVDTSLKMMNFKFISNDSLLIRVFDHPPQPNGMVSFEPLGFVWVVRNIDYFIDHVNFGKRSGIFVRQE